MYLFVKVAIEVFLYFGTVSTAYKRYIYQKYNTVWMKKGGIICYNIMKEKQEMYSKNYRLRKLEERKGDDEEEEHQMVKSKTRKFI